MKKFNKNIALCIALLCGAGSLLPASRAFRAFAQAAPKLGQLGKATAFNANIAPKLSLVSQMPHLAATHKPRHFNFMATPLIPSVHEQTVAKNDQYPIAPKPKPAAQMLAKKASQEKPVLQGAPSQPLISPQKALEQVTIPQEGAPIEPRPSLLPNQNTTLINSQIALYTGIGFAAVTCIGYLGMKYLPEISGTIHSLYTEGISFMKTHGELSEALSDGFEPEKLEDAARNIKEHGTTPKRNKPRLIRCKSSDGKTKAFLLQPKRDNDPLSQQQSIACLHVLKAKNRIAQGLINQKTRNEAIQRILADRKPRSKRT